MGPLKIISDGSLNTRTAWCCDPYADAYRLEYPSGQANLSGDELRGLLARAHAHGLEVATHAIGDAAVAEALAAYDAERRPATAAIVLANRLGGPEGVIDLVEARAPSGFEDLDTVAPYAEREAVVRGYASLAGYAQHRVNRVNRVNRE
jgi:hypothetical protein